MASSMHHGDGQFSRFKMAPSQWFNGQQTPAAVIRTCWLASLIRFDGETDRHFSKWTAELGGKFVVDTISPLFATLVTIFFGRVSFIHLDCLFFQKLA
jgi:hypothetical protein